MKLFVSNSFFLLFAFTFSFLTGAPEAFAEKTQGYSECVEECFLKECGEVGIRCPTVAQKRIYRRKCHGFCREKMRRQEEARRLAAYQRRINFYRMKAEEARKMLLLQHRMWMEKKGLLHRMRMEYLAAKRAHLREKTASLHRKIQQMIDAKFQIERRKLAYKERFYGTRRKMRVEQLKQLKWQVQKLRQALKKTKERNRALAMKRRLQQKERQFKKVRQKEVLLRVDFHKTRLQRHQKTYQHLTLKKNRLLAAKKTAQKQNNHARLMALAKKLGALAGQQAALKRKTQLEKEKLKRAKSILAAYKGPVSDIQ